MSKKIVKKDPLGGRMRTPKPKDGGKAPQSAHVKYDAKKAIKKHGLVPVESIKVENPVTGETKWVTLRRDGTHDAKLIETLADPKMSREQKDAVMSMYLFERGKESASMLMDLWAYKGEHTKQSTVFKNQVRRDVDIMVETFSLFMRDAADRILHGLQFEVRKVKEDGKEKEVLHRLAKNLPAIEIDNLITVMGDLAFYFKQTADLIALRMRDETDRREKEKGKGIYVDIKGGVYSVYEDGDIVQRVEHDMEKIKEEHTDEE
jgi:hypothetical protein